VALDAVLSTVHEIPLEELMEIKLPPPKPGFTTRDPNQTQ